MWFSEKSKNTKQLKYTKGAAIMFVDVGGGVGGGGGYEQFPNILLPSNKRMKEIESEESHWKTIPASPF